MRGTLKKNRRTSTQMPPQMKCSGMEESGVYVRTPTGRTHTYSNATGRMCSNFKAEAVSLQTAAAFIAERKSDKSVALTDSKAAFQSLTSDAPDQAIRGLQEDLRRLPHECTAVLRWIPPALRGIPGNDCPDSLWQSLVAIISNHQAHPHTRRQRPCYATERNREEESHWGLQPNPRSHQPPPETRPDHQSSGCGQATADYGPT